MWSGNGLDTLSVVAPCYNEAVVLPLFIERLERSAAAWDMPWEILLVDDGSVDETWQMIRDQHRRDPRWRGLRLSRNFGHQAAISAGLKHTTGSAVVIMDSDLQDPPELIATFIAEWRKGFEIVYAIRCHRKEGRAKRLAYDTFYRLLAHIAEIRIPLDSGDFCLVDRKVADLLNALPERNRFLRGLRAWVGFQQIGVPYARANRAAGEPKFTLRQLVQLAIDGLLSFSMFPLRLAAWVGVATSVASLALLMARVIGIAAVADSRLVLAAALVFFGGVQLMFLGILGEYVGRIYDEVRLRPSSIVWESVGLPAVASDARVV
jgi:glycosyltransferase involved in cell wall biosynthesis